MLQNLLGVGVGVPSKMCKKEICSETLIKLQKVFFQECKQ